MLCPGPETLKNSLENLVLSRYVSDVAEYWESRKAAVPPASSPVICKFFICFVFKMRVIVSFGPGMIPNIKVKK